MKACQLQRDKYGIPKKAMFCSEGNRGYSRLDNVVQVFQHRQKGLLSRKIQKRHDTSRPRGKTLLMTVDGTAFLLA